MPRAAKPTNPVRRRAAKAVATPALKPPHVPTLRIRLRVYMGEEIALGPGKAQLLEAIARTGSILGAARSLGMSYMRAWTLVRTMNRCFKGPLVRAARGGSRGGRAELTARGRKILELYANMTSKSLRAAEPSWRKVRSQVASRASQRYT